MPDTPAQVLDHYRRALETEMALARRLQDVARRQLDASRDGDVAAVQRAGDERDRLMAGLVAIEQQIGPVRAALREASHAARRLPEFRAIAALHAAVGRMVGAALETDREAIQALQEIVAARRIAARALEQGESTLAAYGRLATPPPAATLVNRRG